MKTRRIIRSILLTTISLFAIALGSVQYRVIASTPTPPHDAWYHTGPYGGSISSIAISPNYANDSTLFAATPYEIWRSVDRGVSWTLIAKIGNGAGGTLIISPAFASDHTLFAYWHWGILYKSTDSGSTWTQVRNTYTENVVMSPNYANDHTLYATSGSVWKSIDAGATWVEKGNGLAGVGAKYIQIAPTYTTDPFLLLATNVGLYKSDDGGESWSPLPGTGLTSPTLVTLLFVSPNFAIDQTVFAIVSGNLGWLGGFFISTDRGQTWSQSNSGLTGSDIRFVAFSPSYGTDHALAVGTNQHGFFESFNSGTSWTARNIGDPNWTVFAGAFTPSFATDKTIFIGGLEFGVLKSTDAGVTWSRSSTGIFDLLGVQIVVSPQFETDHTIFAISNNGVFRSSDGGGTWSPVSKGIPCLWCLRDIAISPQFASDHTVYVGDTSSGVFKSTDEGNNWSQCSNGLTQFFVLKIGVSPAFAQDQTVIVSTPSGLFRTNNGCGSWTYIGSSPGGSDLIALSPNFANDHTVFAEFGVNGSRLIYRSTDSGNTWQLKDNRPPTAIAFSPTYAVDRTVFASVQNYGFLISNDGGDTWTAYNAGVPDQWVFNIAVSPNYPQDQTIYMSSGRGVSRSVDGGHSWNIVGSDLVGVSSINVVGWSTEPHLFAGAGTVWQRILSPILVITTQSLPSGTVGVPYSTILQATGGTPPYRWSVESAPLPQGLTLNESTGEISGTPTAAGIFAFAIRVTDSSSLTVTKQFTVSPPPPSGSAGTPYPSTPIVITPPSSGGTPPPCTNYTLAQGSDPLPPGMSLNPTTGVLSGTPTNGGTYRIVVQCTYNTNQTATKDFTLTINNPVPMLTALTPASTVAGGVGFTLVIDGNNFVRDSIARWNGANRTTTYISSTRLTVAILSTDIEIAGAASITVVNPTPGGGTSNALSFNVIRPNRPPTGNAGGPYSVREGTSVSLNGAGSDPDGDPIAFAWDLNNDGTFETSGQSVTFATGDRDGPSNQNVVLRVCDNKGACGTSPATITIENAPPTATFSAPSTVDEGGPFNLSLINPSDPSVADRTAGFTYAFDCGDSKGFSAPVSANSIPCKAIDNPSQTAQGKIFDKDGGSSPYTKTLGVNNVAPSVGPITAATSPVKVNTIISTTANFTDPGVLDTHTAIWNWDDGSTTAGNVTERNGSGSVTGTHTYTAAGVYSIKLTVTDKDGGQGQSIYQYVVIYDPSAGFVTGGGWINSPAGAYTAALSLSGKATFGFVAKYQKGANTPSGQTEFEFHVANMNFHSTNYQWLVVGGPKAQYKGSGTINGSGDYGFLLTAIDGQQNGGGGADKFRIKIWEKATNKTVYDNQMGVAEDANPTTVIAGGNIVIHTQ